jgi:hypothetical protein
VYLSCGVVVALGDDLFVRGSGLSERAFDLLRHLDVVEGFTVEELSGFTGLKVDPIRRLLRRMASLGMCWRDEDRRWRTQWFDPRAIEKQLGVSGRTARRRATWDAEWEAREAAQRCWKDSVQGGKATTGETFQNQREGCA